MYKLLDEVIIDFDKKNILCESTATKNSFDCD